MQSQKQTKNIQIFLFVGWLVGWLVGAETFFSTQIINETWNQNQSILRSSWTIYLEEMVQLRSSTTSRYSIDFSRLSSICGEGRMRWERMEEKGWRR